ncbi:MAG: Crp/Fnr family transcriptional regulator [Caulobacteraceae bacterium]
MPLASPPTGRELRASELTALFTATGWFARVSEPRRRALVAAGRPHSLPDGGRVYRLGDEPDGLYAVVSGEVRLVNYPELGKQLLGLILRPGRWFGELSVIDSGPRPHDAICVGPTLVLRVPMPDIVALGREDSELYRDIAILSCQHQRLALDRIALMWGHSSTERLVRLLDDFAIPDAETGARVVVIKQEDLAGMVGVSRQRLNQLLRRLETAAMIRTAYGKIVVLDALRTGTLPEIGPAEL